MIVYLDGTPQRFFPGATVRHLAERLDDDRLEAWKRGDLLITDEDGHEVGSGGALSEGAAYLSRRT
jgi:hypothetical protein